MTSKRQRTDMTSDLESVTSITYLSMCILLICFGLILRLFWWPQRPLQPPNSLRVQILPQIWNLWPKLHMQLCLFGLYRPSLEVSKKIKKEERKKDELASTSPVGFIAGKKAIAPLFCKRRTSIRYKGWGEVRGYLLLRNCSTSKAA